LHILLKFKNLTESDKMIRRNFKCWRKY